MVSGAWVFCSQREEEGIVDCGAQRHISSVVPALDGAGPTAQKPRERGPA